MKDIVWVIIFYLLLIAFVFMLGFIKIPIQVSLAAMGIFGTGISLFFKYSSRKDSNVLIRKMEEYQEANTKEHKLLVDSTSELGVGVNFLVNKASSIKQYKSELQDIVDGYVGILNEQSKQFIIAKTNSIISFVIDIHDHGFYNLKGEPFKLETSNTFTQMDYEIKKIDSYGKTVFKDYSAYQAVHQKDIATFSEGLLAIYGRNKNGKHQDLQDLTKVFLRNTIVSFINSKLEIKND